MSIVITEFALGRLFRDRRNTIQDCTPAQFERHLNEVRPERVLDGYAPFCKLHVHRNWTSTRCLAVPITNDNRHLLRSDYEARTKDELPVLVRWFEGIEPPVAQYLIVILYDREQLAREGTSIEGDWGVVGLHVYRRAGGNPDGAGDDDAQCARGGGGRLGCCAGA